MKNNIKDVAKVAGVSTATVSHVINNTRFVADGTKQKVLDAMNSLNYSPNQAARSLRSQKSNIIGLLLPNISNFYFTRLALGVDNILRQNGYNLILSNTNETFQNEKQQIKIFNSQQIEGLIIASAADDHSFLKKDLDIKCPIVFVDRKPKNFNADSVTLDNVDSTYKAIKTLIQKGHTKIGMITGFGHLSTTYERISGYKKAYNECGIELNLNFIKNSDFTKKDGYKFTQELLETTDITAIFLINSLLTIGSLTYLKEKNIKIPKDIAIIGCDDHEWAKVTEPPLTVVSQPAYEMGKMAATLLLKTIKEPQYSYTDYKLLSSLIIRHSC